MGAVEQMELFPSVNEEDMKAARRLLETYPLMRRRIEVFSQKDQLSTGERIKLMDDKRKTAEIEAAFKLIMDDEVKRILEHRYIKAKKHKFTIATFRSTTSVSTINRRIDEGVETIAECLKLAGII